jgi:Lrp/AsnC family leucine-responsive transcriptional regulator
MRFEGEAPELDATDLHILELLQENCKQPLAAIGKEVGLTAPSVVERIHKLEAAGVIHAYVALLDGRALGKDVTAFIGVSIGHPRGIDAFGREIDAVPEVLECHHVTGEFTLLVKVKTENTESLEQVIDRIRHIDGVTRTETMVVLSTHAERTRLSLRDDDLRASRRARRSKLRRAAAGSVSRTT